MITNTDDRSSRPSCLYVMLVLAFLSAVAITILWAIPATADDECNNIICYYEMLDAANARVQQLLPPPAPRKAKPRIIYRVPTPPLQPNGSYYTDKQLAESNKTRYNASGKQQIQRHVTSWRSPLQRYRNQPGVYSSGYLGPLPQGPVDGPYCPEGFNCFYDLREYRKGTAYGR